MNENRQLPAALAAQMEADAKSIASKIGAPSGDKIRVVDKSFKIPGADAMTDRITGVVLDFVSYHAFYDRIYSEKERTPPACYALGNVKPEDLVPSSKSPDVQADSCKECPNNEFGSKGAGKACGNHRILALVEPSDDPNAPIMVFQLPPTSIKYWDEYAASIGAQYKAGVYAVTTDIYLDPNSKWASPRFGNPQYNENIEMHFGRREAALKRLLVEPDVSQWQPLKAAVKAKPKR